MGMQGRNRRQAADRSGQMSWLVWVLGTAGATGVVLGTGWLLSGVPEFIGFLVFLPAIAAGVGTLRQTGLAAGWTVLATVASIVKRPTAHPRENVALVLFAVAFGLFALWLCHQRVTRAAQIERLRSASLAMQRHLVRPLPQVTGQVLLTGVYEPMPQETLAGGDLFDVMQTAYGTRVIIADVQGKGLPALGTAVAVIGAFREAAHREPTLTGLVEALEQAVVRQNDYAAAAEEPQRFVTALILGVDEGPQVQAINCGHLPPYVLGPVGVREVDIGGGALPLGLADLVDEPRTVDWFAMEPLETLLLFTDGLTESRARDGAFFPLAKRLVELQDAEPAQLPRLLWDQSRAYCANRQHDDVAVLALRRNPIAPRRTGI
jgi:uncharacterized membrane protein YhaH (DUF805 family)